PKGMQGNVFVLVRRPPTRVPNIHLAWGASQCVIHRSELDPNATAFRIMHKLLGSPTDLPLLMVHTDPPCEVEFPELHFAADGQATIKATDSMAFDGIQEVDSETDR